MLAFSTLCTNPADDKLICFQSSSESGVWYFIHVISLRYKLHENSNSIFWENKRATAEIIAQHDAHYSIILKILPPKNENFQIKILIFFRISAQNIDCGYSLEPPRWGGSNEYPRSMFLSRHKKNNVYPCKPQFYYIKVGFKGIKIM